MSDSTNKPTFIDRVYDMLPKVLQDKIYDRWVNQEADRIKARGPERDNIITRSVVFGDAAATAHLDAQSVVRPQTPQQIMQRGYLQHEADRLGKISSEIVGALQPMDKRTRELRDHLAAKGMAPVDAQRDAKAIVRGDVNPPPDAPGYRSLREAMADRSGYSTKQSRSHKIEAPRLKL